MENVIKLNKGTRQNVEFNPTTPVGEKIKNELEQRRIEREQRANEVEAIETAKRFLSMPVQFRIEPFMVLLQALAEVESIREQMHEYNVSVMDIYMNAKTKLQQEDDYLIAIEEMFQFVMSDLCEYSEDINKTLESVKRYFPDLEEGKTIQEQYAYYVQLQEKNAGQHTEEINKFLTQVDDNYHEVLFREDDTAKMMYNNVEEFKEARKANFEMELEQLEAEAKAKFENSREELTKAGKYETTNIME